MHDANILEFTRDMDRVYYYSQPVDVPLEGFFADGLHPSEQGYADWSAAMMQYFDEPLRMAKPQPQIDWLAGILDEHLEWLIVRENGRTLPMLALRDRGRNDSNGKTTLAFVDEKGLSVWRVESFDIEESEVVARISSRIRNVAE